MELGKFYTKACLAAVAIGVALAAAGCGGGGSTTATESGVEVMGLLAADRGVSRGVASDGLNPNYTNAFQVPSTYSVAVSKMELLKSADDANPYVVFDTGSVASPKVITLSNADASESLGSNTAYPEAGTYTHMRVTLVYQELTIPADIGDGDGYVARKFRVYSSTVGTVQDGDVLIDEGRVYNWLCGGAFSPITGARPVPGPGQRLVQHHSMAQDSVDSPDPWITTFALATPLVVPANPTGKFTINASFDVATSPEVPGSNGIFMWDDVTPDGQFKPGVDMAQGGDGNEAEYVVNGEPEWTPLQPTISFTLGN